ncbi:hypothetical protein EV582_5591 [Duganella sp. BK701]|nr:hypothetical protein EV582_5591 [Duganella sp. BK701]
MYETLHNLISLLRTKRFAVQDKIFKNQQSISVGIWCCSKKH